MNKFYLIVPVVLLAVFVVLYNGAVKDMATKEAAQKAQVAAKKLEDDNRKAEVERRAQIDAQKRQDERAAQDKAKEDKKIKDYEDAMTALKDESTKYSTEADKLAKEAGNLEISISQARTDKEKLNRETFDLQKQVEQTKINRRNAEIEVQRMIEMVAKKLSENNVVIPAPPPPMPVSTK